MAEGRPIKGWVYRMAAGNSVGFSATTALPLWIGVAGESFGLSASQVSLTATGQIASCALFNFMAPEIGNRVGVVRMGVIAAFLSALADLIIVVSPGAFVPMALFSGMNLGLLLGASNRLIGSSEHSTKGFTLLQIIETMFAGGFFLIGPAAIHSWGLVGLFALTAILKAACGLLLYPVAPLKSLRSEGNFPEGKSAWRAAIMILCAFAAIFAGQSAVWQHVVEIGKANVGLDAVQVGRVMAISVVGGFFGAASARYLSNMLPLRELSIGGTIILLISIIAISISFDVFSFTISTIILTSMTMFIVPLVLSLLSQIDRSGRWASVGPGFLLVGAAMGPQLAAAALAGSNNYMRVSENSALILVVAIGVLFFSSAAARNKIDDFQK